MGTASGKTAAYAIPILIGCTDINLHHPPHHTSTIVLVPTRELCNQVYKEI